MNISLTELFLQELEEEAVSTRRVLERVPEGQNDWKPHPKSMPLGYLAVLVATLPGWVAMTLLQDELDLRPVGQPPPSAQEMTTAADLVKLLDDAVQRGRQALKTSPEEHLFTKWRLLVGGQVVSEETRLHVLRHSVFNHWSHHRGQLTVYLRLNDRPVPSIYGPTADERAFLA